MKKSYIIGIGFACVLGFMSMQKYNSLLQPWNEVNLQTSQVQNVLSRQAQLLPNMAAVAKSYGDLEKSTFIQTAAARAGELSAIAAIKPEDLAKDPELQKKLVDAQSKMNSALASFRTTTEAYPQLKSNEGFNKLMTELEGSINRVTIERQKQQKAIQNFNNQYQPFPGVLLAKLVGYSAFPFYQASDADQRAPDLSSTLK